MRNVSSAYWALCQLDSVNIVELIDLSYRTTTWRWTTSNQEIVNSGYSYAPFTGAAGGGIEESIDLGIATIEFTLSNSGTEFNSILNANEIDMAAIVIRRVHVSTPDGGSAEIYRGRVGDYSFNRNQITGQARNFFNSININWPMYTYMDQCAWRFGSPGCGIDTSSYTISSTSAPVSSGYKLGAYCNIDSAFNSSSMDNYFTKGRFTFTSGANSGYARSVRVHAGNYIEFSHAVPYDISTGDLFELFPGCRKRLVDDCTSKYNNARNFNGYPWIPKQEQSF